MTHETLKCYLYYIRASRFRLEYGGRIMALNHEHARCLLKDRGVKTVAVELYRG